MLNVGGAAVNMTPHGSYSMGFDSQNSDLARGRP